MRRTFFQMAVTLCGLTAQPALTLDLQSKASSKTQTSDMPSDECSSIDHSLMQLPSWLPQSETDTSTPIETFLEHSDNSLIKADASSFAQEEMLAAQVSASQYGFQTEEHADLINFVKDFFENHSELYQLMMGN